MRCLRERPEEGRTVTHAENRPRTGWCGVPTALAMLVFLATAAAAQEFVIDQANDGFMPSLYYGIYLHTPIGQEFRPSFDHVDVVELRIDSSVDTLFQVNIRDDLIAGDIIGSATATAEVCSNSIVRFEFDAPVPVIPQGRYVIQVLDLVGGSAALGLATSDQYPGGRFICEGEPVEAWDAWFREGVWASTPTQALTWGAIKSMYR